MRSIMNFVIRDRKRIVSYAVGGIVATVFNLSAIYLARMVTPYSIAVCVGAAVATVVSFLNAKFFVFGARRSTRQVAEVSRFLSVHSAAGVLYWVISVSLAALIPHLGVLHYSEAIASFIGVSSFAVTGFLGHRFITFAAASSGE
jgi:putative flippase GtrA